MSRLLPLLGFFLLTALLAVGLQRADKKTELPSPLLGKPVPAYTLPALYEPERQVSHRELTGQPYLVNFWASWCAACRGEHPVIEALARTGRIDIIGFNYRDEPDDAKAWLARWGDPYTLHLADQDGRVSIDFGVYAAPETFLIDPQGVVVFKHLGALTEEVVAQEILPRLAAMEASG